MLAYDRNKILTFRKETIDQFTNGICYPRTALVYPSRACNQHCYFCSDDETNAHSKISMMRKELFFSIPKQVKELGCEAIEMCGGGEPFLHPQMLEFIETSRAYGLRLGSLTNGTRLFGEVADRVVDTFSFVRISIDSFIPETYSKIRQVPLTGKNSLDQVLKNIEYLVTKKKEKNSKILITLKSVFSKDTIEELPHYVEFASTLGVDGINIKGVRNVDNQLDTDNLPQYYVDYLENIKKKNVKGKSWVFGSLTNTTIKTPGCFACNFHVFIDTDGSLRMCCYYQNRPIEHTYGILSPTNLRELWESETHKQKVKDIDTTKCNVYNCKYHSYNNVLYDGVINDDGQWQFT